MNLSNNAQNLKKNEYENIFINNEDFFIENKLLNGHFGQDKHSKMFP